MSMTGLWVNVDGRILDVDERHETAHGVAYPFDRLFAAEVEAVAFGDDPEMDLRELTRYGDDPSLTEARKLLDEPGWVRYEPGTLKAMWLEKEGLAPTAARDESMAREAEARNWLSALIAEGADKANDRAESLLFDADAGRLLLITAGWERDASEADLGHWWVYGDLVRMPFEQFHAYCERQRAGERPSFGPLLARGTANTLTYAEVIGSLADGPWQTLTPEHLEEAARKHGLADPREAIGTGEMERIGTPEGDLVVSAEETGLVMTLERPRGNAVVARLDAARADGSMVLTAIDNVSGQDLGVTRWDAEELSRMATDMRPPATAKVMTVGSWQFAAMAYSAGIDKGEWDPTCADDERGILVVASREGNLWRPVADLEWQSEKAMRLPDWLTEAYGVAHAYSAPIHVLAEDLDAGGEPNVVAHYDVDPQREISALEEPADPKAAKPSELRAAASRQTAAPRPHNPGRHV